jgi:hypothetical protein
MVSACRQTQTRPSPRIVQQEAGAGGDLGQALPHPRCPTVARVQPAPGRSTQWQRSARTAHTAPWGGAVIDQSDNVDHRRGIGSRPASALPSQIRAKVTEGPCLPCSCSSVTMTKPTRLPPPVRGNQIAQRAPYENRVDANIPPCPECKAVLPGENVIVRQRQCGRQRPHPCRCASAGTDRSLLAAPAE